MILVTGGAGFIGSNLVKTLNNQGRTDILVVDDLTDGKQFYNLGDCDIADYLDKDDFIQQVKTQANFLKDAQIEVVFHQGACSATTEWNGKYMMENNYEYSKVLLHACQAANIPFIYASSAAVYGGSEVFKEERPHEKPLNVYGYSKWQFDQYVRSQQHKFTSQVVGMRYFNVYGPREQHKGSMASVAFHFNNQLLETGKCKLFGASGGYADGEQQRDFIFVEDVIKVNLWFWQNPAIKGIYNLGTGRSQSFNDVANAVIAWHGKGEKEFIPFPDHLKGAYQSFTQADMTKLKNAGYNQPFASVEEGVAKYLDWLNK